MSFSRTIRTVSSFFVMAAALAGCNGELREDEPSPPGASQTGGGGGASSTCSAADADDGTSAAASLGAGSLDCQVEVQKGSSWLGVTGGCGAGWRLPTKGEALKIAASPTVCRTPPGEWFTWTRTCAGPGVAWGVSSDGFAMPEYVNYISYLGKLCVR